MKNGSIPSDIVSQFGGHKELGEKLAKSTGGNLDDMAGFTLISQSNNVMEVRWNSVSLNTSNGFGGQNGQANTLRTEFQNNIMDALRSAFKDVNFISK